MEEANIDDCMASLEECLYNLKDIVRKMEKLNNSLLKSDVFDIEASVEKMIHHIEEIKEEHD